MGKNVKCSKCGKEIRGNEEVYIKMRYPKRKLLTEITAFLRKEGQLICEGCWNERSKK